MPQPNVLNRVTAHNQSKVDFSGIAETIQRDSFIAESSITIMATVLIAIDESNFAENAFKCKYTS